MKPSELRKLTVAELRRLAGSLGIAGTSRLRKEELVEKLAAATRRAEARGKPKRTSAQQRKASGREAQTRKPRASKKPAAGTRKPRAAKARRKRRDVEEIGPVAALSPRTRRAFSAYRSLAEQRVKASKYYLGVRQPPELDEAFDYPKTHGEDVIVLMVRDPYWLFAYWEFSPELRADLKGRIGQEELLRSRLVLRVYDVTDTDPDRPVDYHDIDVAPEARNWYINVVRVERDYCVDLGLITPDGRFVIIARSNRVSLPPVGPSDVVDEEWVALEALDEIYARSESERGPSSGSGGWGPGGLGH